MGLRIAQARRKLAFTEGRDIGRADMARALGVVAETVRSWEEGETRPSRPREARLAAYLRVNQAWLRYGTGPVEAEPDQVYTDLPEDGQRRG